MPEKLRAILDTNSYGWIIEHDILLGERLADTTKVQIYGFELIRKELRATPPSIKSGDSNVRMDLLKLYDKLVKQPEYRTNQLIEELASEYLNAYHGGISKSTLEKDFRIVACASLHRLDIIVSEDQHSMCSEPAMVAYKMVNAKNELPLPAFHKTTELRKLV